MKSLTFVILFLLYFSQTNSKFSLPEMRIEVFRPSGLKISMPANDEDKLQLFGFHANINKPIRGKEQGDISRSADRPINGRWVLEDDSATLKVGDTLHYWVFAQNNRLGFDKEDQAFQVKELLDKPDDSECAQSITKINNGGKACVNQIVFEDKFDTATVDTTKWEIQQYIPMYIEPDYEFVSYELNPEALYINNKNLYIKPIVRKDNNAAELDLRNGCTLTPQQTSEVETGCKVELESYKILPPVISGKLRSRFSFKYGRIEIRAQMPIGDWIYPQLRLESKSWTYGPLNESSEIWIAYARGNLDLTSKENVDIGNNMLYSGPVFKTDDKTSQAIKSPGRKWSSDFHTFTLKWTPEEISFLVDGNKYGDYRTPAEGFNSLGTTLGLSTHRWTTKYAPFDEDFVISLGVGVGGRCDFPDKVISPNKKPWTNKAPKAPINFRNAESAWRPTWRDNDIALKVEYVRVYAL